VGRCGRGGWNEVLRWLTRFGGDSNPRVGARGSVDSDDGFQWEDLGGVPVIGPPTYHSKTCNCHHVGYSFFRPKRKYVDGVEKGTPIFFVVDNDLRYCMLLLHFGY